MGAGSLLLPIKLPHGAQRLVTPLVMASLLVAAVAVWIGVNDAAGKHGVKSAPTPPPVVVSKEEAPRKYTQPFLPAIVPLGGSRKPVYLYVSPNTARFFASTGGNYDSLLAPWRSFFKAGKLAYVETSRLDAISITPTGASTVLVVPSAIALSQAERKQLSVFQQKGGNILATWSLGARGDDGKWEGYGLLEVLFGVKVAGEVAPTSEERFLNLLGELPLTAGYPAGQRVWLENTAEKMLRYSAASPSTNPAALYTDWVRNRVPLAASTAVAYGEYGAERGHARWVAIGFAETSWGTQHHVIAGLLQNALHWLENGVAVTKAAWPMPHRAAYVIEMDTEEGFANARGFARMMEAIDAKATFYCLTSQAVRFPHFVRDLAKRHEIGYHGDVHVGFIAQPEAEQRGRFDRMKSEMKSIIGDSVDAVGFRAPFEQYERTTERLLHSEGFKHHAADPNRTDARLPFFSESGSKSPARALVVLPRTQHDDVSLLQDMQSDKDKDKDKLFATLAFDFHLARDMGAMGLLSIHSQNFAEDAVLAAVMPDLLKEVAEHRQQVWIASSNDIADWWRERERIRFKVSGTSDKILLDLTIAKDRPLGKVALIITNRRAGQSFSVEPLLADVQLRTQPLDRFRTAILLEGLAPGRYSYRLKPVRQPPSTATQRDLSARPAALASRASISLARQSGRFPKARASSGSNAPAS
jgi:peptidoglycan/xylan/chitin deacetylase (PgdA/CDA1 family)